MKIQCACGAKYEFAVSPEMAQRPVKFVCTACGLDSTEYVTRLVQQELAQAYGSAPAPAAAAPTGVLLNSPPPAPAPAQLAVRMRVATPQQSAPEQPAETVEEPSEPPCLKHPGYYATHRCYICKKPICPKCMELFGYVCSPLCNAKANSHGIQVPVYEGQRSVIEAKRWRAIARASGLAAVAVVLLVSFWIWYAWFGSLPKPIYSFRFEQPSYSGESIICGNDQIVFLHGSVLARHDMKEKKVIWSRDLVDHKQVAADAAKELEELKTEHTRMMDENPDMLEFAGRFKIPSLETLTKRLEKYKAASLQLYVRGKNVWVTEDGAPAKVVRYDWDTGNPGKELNFDSDYYDFKVVGDELLVEQERYLQKTKDMTYVNLNTCESRVEEIGTPEALAASATNAPAKRPGILVWARNPSDSQGAGLPIGTPGKDMGKPLDPGKVAEQVRHLPLPARIALPAVIAGNISQERAMTEMADDSKPRQQIAVQRDPGEQVTFLPTADGYIRVGVKLVESKVAVRNGMKAPSGKSVVDSGNLTTGNTLDATAEILNDLQRQRGGANVYENVSRYHVRLGKADGPEDWSGDLTGPPSFFPLQTVNVVAANKQILVFSKANKLLWKATLTYNVGEDWGALEPGEAQNGQGPCVEKQGVLYIFDEGVLSAFDLATGNARWRLPSVGIVGMFFDDRGAMYVNTTTANLDSIKYPRQIDLSSRVNDVVLKIDCKTGKIIWSAEPGGLVNYVSGKFLFVVREYQPYEPDDDEEDAMASLGANDQPYLRIRRLNPSSGTEMWEHFQQRAPLDIQFDKNIIRLVFKKEVQVLKFMTF